MRQVSISDQYNGDQFGRSTQKSENDRLGLPIARWIAEAHGGSLLLERSDAADTTFVRNSLRSCHQRFIYRVKQSGGELYAVRPRFPCLSFWPRCRQSPVPRPARRCRPKLPTSSGRQPGPAMRLDPAPAPTLPAGVRIEDGLTPDEAVAVALWNNAAFQVSVASWASPRRSPRRRRLDQPGAVAALPGRTQAARSHLALARGGALGTASTGRPARLAADAAGHGSCKPGWTRPRGPQRAADLGAPRLDRQRWRRRRPALLARIDTLTQSRLAAGDIGELDARAARVDAARGTTGRRADGARHRHRARALAPLAGWLPMTPAFRRARLPSPPRVGPPLTSARSAGRPPGRARRRARGGNGGRAPRVGEKPHPDADGRARRQRPGIEGFEAGPGVDASLPIFNRNQGGRHARSGAPACVGRLAPLQQQVALELREATACSTRRSSRSRRGGNGRPPSRANLTGAKRRLPKARPRISSCSSIPGG